MRKHNPFPPDYLSMRKSYKMWLGRSYLCNPLRMLWLNSEQSLIISYLYFLQLKK